MDSINSFSPPTFLDLLSSQHDPNSTAFPSQPVQCTHPFSSQPVTFSNPSVPENCIDLSVDENEADGGRESRKRWTPQEDVKLISAWLNTSKDPVVSNEQRIDRFWKRVSDYFTASDGASNTRGPTQCKARWNKINHQVNKFVGCYTRASTRKKSGESEDDVMTVANLLYKNDMKKSFTLGHCWRELKHDQKWKTEDSCLTNDEPEMRPPGIKASKKKGKKPAVSNDVEDGSVVKLDRIIAMKDKEQEAKDRHGRMKLLDSLINKAELTPAEVTLRDMLVHQMLTKT